MAINTKLIQSISELLNKVDPQNEFYDLAQQIVGQLKEFFSQVVNADPDELELLHVELEGYARRNDLFQELGKVVKKFYENLRVIKMDVSDRLRNLQTLDMDDATGRLEHIVQMTENAANKTLDLAEKVQNNLLDDQARNSELQGVLEALRAKASDEDAAKLDQALQLTQQNQQNMEGYQNDLTEILLAQDYQDLTGQVIGKIIRLLQQMESELLIMLKEFQNEGKAAANSKAGELRGPLHDTHEERQSQNDVDDLLSSLGF